MKQHKQQLKLAANCGLASLLNLTVLPLISFIYLVVILKKTEASTLAHYYAKLGIKTNIIAAITLLLVSALMILLGGFDSPWTWVYVISYFTLVHTFFILFATWALVRSWAGERLKNN